MKKENCERRDYKKGVNESEVGWVSGRKGVAKGVKRYRVGIINNLLANEC